MGFGHRVYKNYDPRAKLIQKLADQVFEVTGRNPLTDIALELERIALQDDYFVSRKLYPNVDFYSGLIYDSMQFPTDMFTVLFAIPRTAGWLAQWNELVDDKDQKISRPRQGMRRAAATTSREPVDSTGWGRGEGRGAGAPHDAPLSRISARIVFAQHASRLAFCRIRSTTASSSAGSPRDVSQNTTFDFPDIGPTSIS
jgi:hypothetical protein